MNPSEEKALQIFAARGGVLRTHQALDEGIAPRTLYALRDAGWVLPISRGVYQLSSREPLSHPDLIQVALRVPKAVICLISALDYHQLTDQIPHRVDIALPRLAEKPRLDYPPIQIVWLSPEVYEAGITETILDGVKVRIYSREKTIADCFKFRRKVGKEVALQALKEYLASPGKQLDLLMEFARLNRVSSLISTYLEVWL